MVEVLAEIERFVVPTNHHLEVANDGVDPGELRQAVWLAPGDDDMRMSAARVNATGHDIRAGAANVAAVQSYGLGSICEALLGTFADRSELHPHGTVGVAGGRLTRGGRLVW